MDLIDNDSSEQFSNLLKKAFEYSQKIKAELTYNDLHFQGNSGDKKYPYLEQYDVGDVIVKLLQEEGLLPKHHKIEVWPMPDKRHIWGLQLHFPPQENEPYGRASIWVLVKEDDVRIYRFTLIKELCQFYCDKFYGYAKHLYDIDKFIKELREKLDELEKDFKGFNIRISSDPYTEFLALVMALLLIFPPECLDSFLQTLKQEDEPYSKLANYYEIPEPIVKFFAEKILPIYPS